LSIIAPINSSGFLTQKDIVRQSYLPARTVRYALNRLKEENVFGSCSISMMLARACTG